MRVAIYNPYLDTLGGGERYTVSFARAVLEQGFQVDLQWDKKDILPKLSNRFGMKLEGINVVEDIKRGDGYDVCFWFSDGSIPILRSRNNILHFQVPFTTTNGKSLLNRMKLYRINSVVCNSKFTKRVVDKTYSVKSIVIYPPVGVEEIKPKRKEKWIVFIGRFSQLKQVKGQDVLVKTFRKLLKRKEMEGWEMILAGGTEVGTDKYIGRLKKLANGLPVRIVESPGYKDLLELYGKAKIFWSASGYGIDEEKEPEKVEHFGITVVEAMAAGCVPAVFNAGGHKEIIKNGKNGYLWDKQKDLIEKTVRISGDFKLYKKLSDKAKNDSLRFSYESFKNAFLEIV